MLFSTLDACCHNKTDELARLRGGQARALRIVLVVNAAMFLIESSSGLLAHSFALVADSLDMLSDSLVYGFSLFVVHRSASWKVRAAYTKAAAMGLFGILVLAQLAYKLTHLQVPVVQTMSLVGTLALLANAFCFLVLWHHRADDINMRSVWLCSRNDLVANGLVLLAAGAVWATASPWPDIVVGALIAALFLRSALAVTLDARATLAGSTH